MAEKGQAQQPQGPTEAQLRELVMHGENLRQQLAALESQRELLQELLSDARRSHLTLEHLESAKDGDDILVPVGAGAFVNARLQHGGKSLASLGSGIHAELSVGEARDRMRARVESLEGANAQSTKDAQRVADELNRVNAVLEQYYGG